MSISKLNIATHYPIADIKEHLVFANNGNVVACYKIDLPEIYSLSEQDFEELHSTWLQAFKSLPVGTVIHKQDFYLKKEFTADNLANDTFLARATYDHFKGRLFIAHTGYLFFTLTKNRNLNSSKYVNPFRKSSRSIYTELNKNVESFIVNVSDSVSYINNSRKVQLSPLGEKEILKLTSDFFNGFSKGADTDMLLSTSGVSIGDHHFDVLAVNSETCFEESVQTSKTNDRFTSDDFVFHQGFIDGLGLTLNENHIVNQIIYLDEKHKWRKALDKKVAELKKSSNFGSQNKIVLEKIEHILHQINNDDSARIVRGHLNIIYWSREADELSSIASKVKTEFKELNITPYAPKGEARKHYILNSFGLFSSNFSNEDLYVTDLKHALCLLINNTSYSSDKTGILFNDREHNLPVLKDVWDEKKKRIKVQNPVKVNHCFRSKVNHPFRFKLRIAFRIKVSQY